MTKIKAYRDGQEREFTPRVWDAMGIGHCGWAEVPALPKELEQAPAVPKEVENLLTKQPKTRQKK